MKKKKILIVFIVILLLCAVGFGVYYFISHKKKNPDVKGLVYVDSVSNIMGLGGSMNNRYMGVVESQETEKVEASSNRKVKKLYVEEGDSVKKGDKLFDYDTDESDLKLKQLELGLQSINNEITTTNNQINELAAERDLAPADSKLEYTSQIQNLQAQVNQLNYDASSKQLEIDRFKASIENTTVTAPMDGVVKEINKSAAVMSDNIEDSDSGSDFSDDSDYGDDFSDSYGGNYGDSENKPFISLMAMGDYRVKATASELNVRSMSVGDSIIIRSRRDESLTWTGKISVIDLEHPESSGNDYYYDGGGETASNYPFYISIDNVEGLILGEHLYVEPDYGQGGTKEGVWLSEYYIVQEEAGSYVWVENSKGRIEKRIVTLGDHDDELMQYEILSGLTNEDYIAYPEKRIKEGMKTTRNYQDVMEYEDFDDASMTDGMYEDYDDASMTDGMYEDFDMEDMDGVDVDMNDMEEMDGSDIDMDDVDGVDMDMEDIDDSDMEDMDMDENSVVMDPEG